MKVQLNLMPLLHRVEFVGDVSNDLLKRMLICQFKPGLPQFPDN